jgi:hypothetical protein
VREVDVDDFTIAAVEKSVLPAAGVVDQLMREHEIADRIFAANGADRRHRQNGCDPAFLQRPKIGPVVHPVGRNRVPLPVAREKNHVAPADLPEDQRRRGLSVGRADDFAAGDGERGQAGKPAATDDGKHGIRRSKGKS